MRWNRTRKLDGVGWDTLPAEMTKRTVRASLVGLGAGTTESEMARMKGLLKSVSRSPFLRPFGAGRTDA